MGSLHEQARNYKVQILWIGDNKAFSVGEKRNYLLDMARGEYLTFIDDDDQVSDNYIKTIIDYTKAFPDVTVFCHEVEKLYDGKFEKTQYFSKERGTINMNRKPGRGRKHPLTGKPLEYKMQLMTPNHLMIWKSDVAKRERFPGYNLSEDIEWANLMNKHIDQEMQIAERLYTYDFDKKKSETRNR